MTDGLLQARARTHGAFADNARYAQHFKSLFRSSPKWAAMTDIQREALDCIGLKLARILSNPATADSWADVAGYATLAERSLVE